MNSRASSHTPFPATPSASGTDVCIVGNGVIGKVAALGFAQAGQRVTLVCPPGTSPPPAEGWDVRVYALNHVAHALLSSLKVWDALDATRVEPVDAMAIQSGEAGSTATGQLGILNFDAFGAQVGTLAWIVEDSNLNQALNAALKFAANITIVRARATVLKQETERAQLHLDQGVPISAALIVGADGAQSWVRAQADIGIDYRSYEQRAVVTNLACALPHRGVAHQWFTAAEGIVALLPLPGQRVSLVWSAPDVLAETLMRESPAQLAARVTTIAHAQLGQLQPLLPECVKAVPLSLMRAHAMTAPRVALVGDAAHVVHPLAGHGMNLGFADVATLLKTVINRDAPRELPSDCGDPRLLARYARSRKEEVLLMQLATDGLARLFNTEFEPLRLLRNAGLNFLDKLPVIKRHLIHHALGRPL
ncbi:MAG: FAD-dependent monooxygenase [Pseudomonadota bacterium]